MYFGFRTDVSREGASSRGLLTMHRFRRPTLWTTRAALLQVKNRIIISTVLQSMRKLALNKDGLEGSGAENFLHTGDM